MFADVLFLAPVALALVLVLWSRRKRVASEVAPDRAIVVDGSNVMHWGGEPSAKVLSQVLRAVEAKGLRPMVFFDANVGYKLAASFLDAHELSLLIGVKSSQIHVVDKGVVADETILAYSAKNRLRIVSNDRYREWRSQFPHVAKKGQMLRGEYRDGAVIWRDNGSFR